MIGIVTAVYDNFDELRPLPEQSEEVDAVCVTDDPELEAPGWRIMYEPRPGVDPNRAAKTGKCLPWAYSDCEVTIWLDAQFEVVSSDFARTAATCVDAAHPIAQYPHPQRDCIYEEAAVSATMARYHGEPLAEQVAHYRLALGHPPGWGLYAAGVTVRLDTPKVRAMGSAWLHQINRWSVQDQVSLPVVLRAYGLRPAPLPPYHELGIVHSPSDRHDYGVDRRVGTMLHG
jgi:hypothetical protein